MSNQDASDVMHMMQAVYDEADCLYSSSQVEQAIARLGDEISHHLSSRNPIVMTVMNGGLVFAGQLLTRLNFPLQLDYVHATRYLDKEVGDKLHWKVPPSILMSGRDVLLLDDILDQGNTLLEIKDYCLQQKAKSVNIAVLLDKIHERKASAGFKADFTGLEVEDRFVFGYGMDYKGYWRNAPGIYAVKGL